MFAFPVFCIYKSNYFMKNKFLPQIVYIYLLTGLFLQISFTLHAKENEELSFIKNIRQWPAQVQYKAELPGGAVFLTNDGFTYSFYDAKDLQRIHKDNEKGINTQDEKIHSYAYAMYFMHTERSCTIETSKQQSYYYNYFIGSDTSKWSGHVPLYGEIYYRNLYAGIDAKIYSHGKSLKYDFLVKPHNDPSKIIMAYKGVNPRLSKKGDLLLPTSLNTITEQAPYAYQVIDGIKKQIKCKYHLNNAGQVSFCFPEGYDKNKELIIDPTVIFATYSGGNGNTFGFSATYDNNGNFYGAAECYTPGWLTTTGSYMVSFPGGVDIGINKFNTIGTVLLYSTYYGPASAPEAVTVNSQNQLILCGLSSQPTTPVTPGCFSNTYQGGFDFIIARFSEDGSTLKAATYVGGSGYEGYNTVYSGVNNIALSKNIGDVNRAEAITDSIGNIYIASYTKSSDFPVTSGAFQTTYGGQEDACIFKLDSSCSTLVYSTYLGGSAPDVAFGLSINNNGEAVVTGGTGSSNFPVTNGVLQPVVQGGADAFVTILNASGTGILHSTYLGTSSFDHGFKVQYDHSGNIYVCGQTIGNFPVSPNTFSMPNGNIFIDKLSSDLSTSLLSTRIGIAATDIDSLLTPEAFMADDCGNVYFSGFDIRFAPNLPVTTNALQTTPSDFWFTKLTNNMSVQNFASYYGVWGDHTDGGGSHFNKDGVLYEAICNVTGFPTTPGVFQPTDLVTWLTDQVSLKIDFQGTGSGGVVIAAFGTANSNDTLCNPDSVSFTNNSTHALSYEWNFGDGSPVDTNTNPIHFFAQPGTYHVVLHAYNPSLCIPEDTSSITIHVFDVVQPKLNLHDTLICDSAGLVTLTAQVTNLNNQMYFHWEPANAIISGTQNMQTVLVNGNVSNTFIVTATDSVGNLCKASTTGMLHMQVSNISFLHAFGDTIICKGDTAHLYAVGGTSYNWQPDNNIISQNDSEVMVFPTDNTIYTVIIGNSDGCKVSRNVNVVVKPTPTADAGPDQYIKIGETAYLHAFGGTSYEWYPTVNLSSSNTTITAANPNQTTEYFVTVHNDYGCSATDSVKVYVWNLFIPNSFSPNSDGLNDIFSVKYTGSNVHLLEMYIYNRWGEIVFYTNNLQNGWDGNYKGHPVDIGTYFYQIEYSIGEKIYNEKGNLTLIR